MTPKIEIVQKAIYDHLFKRPKFLGGKKLTVESKFNTSRLTSNQRAARGNVETPGGLIIDRTTSEGLGNTVETFIKGTSIGAYE